MTEQKIITAINPNGGEPGYTPDWKERIQTMLPEQAASAAIAAGSEVLRTALAELHPDEREPVWRWGGLEDLLAPLKPVEYIVSGMIPKGSMTLLFGADGSLKSMLAMDLAVCVATGKEYLVGLDHQANGFTTKEATVLWYDADNGEYLVRERLRAFLIGHQVWPERLHYLSYPDPLFDASDDLMTRYMIDDIKEREAELVIFDNLTTISGDVDENSPEMNRVMTRLKRIVEETGVAMIIIHHVTKATGGYRGHGRIRQSVDLALKITRSSPTSDVVEVLVDKIRRRPVSPFAGLFTYENEGDILSTARFFGTAPSTGMEKDTKVELVKEQIINLLQDRPGLNQSEIVKKIEEIGRNSIIVALDQLVQDGVLITEQGPRNSKIYQLKLPISD